MTTIVLQFLLEAQSFALALTLLSNILIGTFLLVSCSNTFQNLLWFLYGQGQKSGVIKSLYFVLLFKFF